MYEKIARAMKEAGYERSADQCREKAKKLKADYRKIKDAHNKMGIERKKLEVLDAMDNILGDKPSMKPPVLVDTLDLNDEDAENSIRDTIASTAQSNGMLLIPTVCVMLAVTPLHHQREIRKEFVKIRL